MTEQGDALARAGDLLAKLEQLRARLEATEDPDTALELLGQFSELARQAHAKIEEAVREADARS